MIKAIETVYRGHRFRSRTEARWAVFFDSAGIAFDYEPEGVVLDGESYLPDFWLPSAKTWLEIKGISPTDRERGLCRKLANESGHSCLLAVGQPSRDNSVYLFRSNPDELDWMGRGDCAFHFDDSRDQPKEIWMTALDRSNWFRLIEANPRHQSVRWAYEASNSARFEFGQSGPSQPLHRQSRHSFRRVDASPELREKIGSWRGKYQL